MTAPPTAAAPPALRQALSSLQGLLALALLLGDDRSEDEVVQLAVTAVPALGPCRVEGVLHAGLGWRTTAGACARPGSRARIQAQLNRTGPGGGPLVVPERTWAWAFVLRSREQHLGHLGHLVVTADRTPSGPELHLLQMLVAQTGSALAAARSRARDRAEAAQLRATNAMLAETVAALRRRTAVHDRLLDEVVSGAGRSGIARALHELTGLAASVEDAHGNVLARSGPQPSVDPPLRRDRALRRALAAGGPVRRQGRVLVAARRDAQVLGVLVLADPDGRAGEDELTALKLGAAVLTLELARLQGIADTELRLGRDVVADLVDGADAAGAVERARAVGHDLGRAHRVLVVEGPGEPVALLAAVRQAVRDHRSPLVMPRDGSVVAVVAVGPEAADDSGRWERLRTAVLAGHGVRRCRIGVGGVAAGPADYPRSHHEAARALRMHDVVGGEDRAVCYDELGIYQLLCEVADADGVARFIRRWLGPLIDYDEARGTDLVTTVGRFLECGGSYDATAADMALGRSTVRYRLRRIRQISGHDMAQPDTRFNLHVATRALAAQRATAR